MVKRITSWARSRTVEFLSGFVVGLITTAFAVFYLINQLCDALTKKG